MEQLKLWMLGRKGSAQSAHRRAEVPAIRRSENQFVSQLNQPKIDPTSTQNRPKLFLGQVFVELWGILAGKWATSVDFGRFWPSRWSRAEPKLEPCWGQVEIFWSRKRDFGGLEEQE